MASLDRAAAAGARVRPGLPFWRRALCLPLCLLLCGCGVQDTAGAAAASAADLAAPTGVSVIAQTAAPVPAAQTDAPAATAAPTQEPEMIIADSGDITLRADLAASYLACTFSFAEAPRILIYHTHATESYLQSDADSYLETETGRTENNDYNVITVGEQLKSQLEALGFTVFHDTSNVEAPELSSAYSRSLLVMEQYADIDLYIDLHRNSSNKPGPSENTVSVDGVPCAKFFFVVGTGIGTYEGEYDTAPDWQRNYTLATSVMAAVAPEAQALLKPIRLKVGRYNQHMGLCLLAEIGTNRDSLAAVENSVPYLAGAIAAVCTFPAASNQE